MNKLKSKIKFLENKIIKNKSALRLQQSYLHQKIDHIKTTYFAAQVIVGGFLIGYLLGSKQLAGGLKQLLARSVVFLNAMRIVNRYITFFNYPRLN